MPKPLAVKERSLTHFTEPGGRIIRESDGSTQTQFNKQGDQQLGRQYTVSEGHVPSSDGKYRAGGPFYTIRMEQHQQTRDVVLHNGGVNKNLEYRGPITLTAPELDISDKAREKYRSVDTSDLDPAGATAMSLCSPTNPVASLATGSAEAYREGLPSLPGVSTWKSRLGVILNAGSEFLNVEFGWLPLLNEIEKTFEAIQNHNKIIQQYERDANRQVRRGFNYPIEHTSSETKASGRAGFVGGSTGSFNFGEAGTITTRTEVTSRKWFEGAFVHPPLGGGNALSKVTGAGSQADILFGTSLTPNVLWELTPWSWAADWFTNAGEVINNFTNMVQYGLIMRYGYIMEEKSTTIFRSIDRSGLISKTGVELGVCPSSLTKITSKVRRPANPFGFGIDSTSMSLEQIAILAAVGISFLL